MLALASVILLAYLWPAPGVQKQPLSLSTIANYGVSLIFFFYGLKLSPQKFTDSLGNWRLHSVIQASTFILFPAIGFALYYLFGSKELSVLWLGILYVTALPSTVSSSVVMVSVARGNVPAAIFNASLSGLIGIILTPLIMSPVLETTAANFDVREAILKLALQVLVPVAAGMALHSTRLGRWTEQHSKKLRYMDQSVILLIVYISFCESFAGHMFSSLSLFTLVMVAFGMIVLFGLIFFLIYRVSLWMRFGWEDRITALFCGTKKSLVHGTVMAKVLFAGGTAMGMVLLPIMLYHASQLILASVIAQRMARRG